MIHIFTDTLTIDAIQFYLNFATDELLYCTEDILCKTQCDTYVRLIWKDKVCRITDSNKIFQKSTKWFVKVDMSDSDIVRDVHSLGAEEVSWKFRVDPPPSTQNPVAALIYK